MEKKFWASTEFKNLLVHLQSQPNLNDRQRNAPNIQHYFPAGFKLRH